MANQSDLVSKNVVESTMNEEVSATKKRFIEPELSAAVDVLEATTFFQGVTSGSTN